MSRLVSVLLASASPRRLELLASLGLHVRVVPSDVVEGDRPGFSPARLASFHADAKADAVSAREPAGLIVAADTVVDLDGKSLGKPVDALDAAAMLRALSDREHVVHTAFSLRDASRDLRYHASSSTRVRFTALDEATIQTYIATGEPFDKAGGYGIQGRGAALVERIDGDFYTVMGFPLGAFVRALPELGYSLADSGTAVPA